jgi:hypothetical protein
VAAVLWAGAGGLAASAWLTATWLTAAHPPTGSRPDLFNLAAGVGVTATLGAGVLVAMALVASRQRLDQVDPAASLWVPLAVAAGGVAPAQIAVLAGRLSPIGALAIAASVVAASLLATGLYLRGFHRARDARRKDARQVEPMALEIAEYTAADACFEGELLSRLFQQRAALAHVRASTEELRVARAGLLAALEKIRGELRALEERARAAREEYSDRIHLHAERIRRWQEWQATLDLNVTSAYRMGRSLRALSDTRILEDTDVALSA